jgi:hypothetical protein
MSAPQDPKVVNSFGIRHLWHALFVFITFLVIDFLYYGLILNVTPYTQHLLGKIIWTAVIAISFTVIYNHSAIWRPEVITNLPGKFFPRLVNSIFFSLVVYLLILAAIALSSYLVSVLFIYVLDAFRGIPEDGADDTILATQIIVSGAVLEYCGKDETQEGRTGGGA